MTLLTFGILATAVQYILGGSALTKSIRDRIRPAFLQRGIECPPCCGFWIGLALHFSQTASSAESPCASYVEAGAAGLVLTAVGRSLMSLGYVEETK